MKNIFEITGTDKREELLQAIRDDEPFISQALGGKDIEKFDDEHGFVLLEKEKSYLPTNLALLRTKAAIEVYSLLGRCSLRTAYYTCRQKPEFAKYFEGTKNFNTVWLDTVSRQLEILCDIDRDILTFGTPGGVFFFPYSRQFGSKKAMIALSEDLATMHLKDSEIKHCMNILINEKMANALELINDKTEFLKLSNMACTTRGGRPNKAILKLVNRFATQKNVLLWCDADVWGEDMREVIRRGSKNLRHTTLSQTSSRAFDVGLFPSVAEALDVPVDIDEKRPMSGDEKTGSRKMVEHLKNGGLNILDLQTFYNDKTFEIEGLHATFVNDQNRPIGTQLYLTEYLRIMNLKCKPEPPIDDEKLRNDLANELTIQLEQQLRESLNEQINLDVDINIFNDLIIAFREQKINEIMLQNKNTITQILETVSMEELRNRINNWYVHHMKSEIYNLSDIVNEMIKEIKIDIKNNFENLQNEIDMLIKKVSENIQDELLTTEITASMQLKEFKKVETVINYYDAILKKLGASPKDALKIRNALQKRLNIK